MNPATIPAIIEQHAAEAAFLWVLRRHAVHAPHFRLEDLVKLDNRVEAHLDGLRVAGEEGWRQCELALESGESGEVFAAGLLALDNQDPAKLAKLLAIAEASEDAAKALVSAFGWVDPSRLVGTVKQLLASSSSFNQCIGIAACAIHRVNPGAILEQWVCDVEAPLPLRIRALRVAGELKRRDLLDPIQDCLHSEPASIRFWAAWAAVLLGDRGEALDVLKTFLVAGSEFSQRPLPMLLRAMPMASSHAWLKDLAQSPERQRDLIAGVGMVGDPLYAPWLIKQMEKPELARLAGESFSLITGADIANEGLDGNQPEGFDSGPTETPQDENVAMDQDENLPWPDAKKMQAWWIDKKNRFQPGIRHLSGAPISEAQCLNILREGFQRQRTAAALELALMRPDAHLFEVRAPGWRQHRILHPN